ncbi:Mu transposase C-terminal domain-containing protein [Vibrio penaeicida]|uniref:Mu transposase C-terminal domain-containing protein n=1 Tax=Vibrio penaeicida TaxID=104609 RepID=UPI000CEA378A|nr:DDE-type integrase/transposase/recombinase [Vibrio penaeicida]
MDNEFLNKNFKPNREQVSVDVGNIVYRGNDLFVIKEIVDFSTVIATSPVTNRTAVLKVKELRPANVQMENSVVEIDLSDISEKDWETAEYRFNAIKPFIQLEKVGRNLVKKRAEEINVDPATLYRWLKRYRSYGLVIALAPKRRGWKKGNSRLSNKEEEIINEVINDYYLTQQRPSAANVILEVQRRCHNACIKSPCHSAIRARIASVSERERLRKHGFRDKAINKFKPAPGTFPGANYPLSVIQIDHTPADIIIVDDEHREPIGRPWITMAIDVYSRMVVGYYLSLDPPTETSVAMCVAHSILPKEEWLTLHNIDTDWPVWGVPAKIHVDNGADFRSDNFQRSCAAYGIELQFRPVKQPQYGGHVERLLGTFLSDIHNLPGTTFSDIKAREGYDSDKHSALTLSELEEWLVRKICKIYNNKKHSSIGMSPIQKWNEGIFGTNDSPGAGLPPRPVNKNTIQLDFMPSFYRTVQPFGVSIDKLRYYSESLRPWINAIDPETSKKRKLLFRRDPRSLKTIWFYDPTLKQYFEVPFSDQSKPDLSLWELRKAQEKLKLSGQKGINEAQIFEALNEQRELVDAAKKNTKRARRQAQRRKVHAQEVTPASPSIKSQSDSKSFTPTESSDWDLLEEEVSGYGDIA